MDRKQEDHRSRSEELLWNVTSKKINEKTSRFTFKSEMG